MICGLEDVLDLIEESAGPASGHGRAGTVTEAHLHESIADVRDVLKPASDGFLVPLREKAIIVGDIARTMVSAQPTERNKDVLEWSDLLLRQIDEHGRDLRAEQDPSDLLRRLAALARACDQTVQAMDFGLLFDSTKKLFFIGFKPAEKKPDPIHYDMLASEARLASFVAIAKGDVPAAHWFRLARSFAPLSRGSTLLSWSGSMFEYLMPSLVMQTPAGSLMDHAGRAVVHRQIAYGKSAMSLGRFRVRLQRARPRLYLSILHLWCSRAWLEAGACGGSGDRPVRHRFGRDGGPVRSRQQFQPLGGTGGR
ncbi:MAG: hypothetical protein IPN19_11125 [Elusimicrobia bacterium]|nr:hypothetical protein [Elusimicrobiota bacterium]